KVVLLVVLLVVQLVPSDARFSGLVRAGGKLVKKLIPEIIKLGPAIVRGGAKPGESPWTPWKKWNQHAGEEISFEDALDLEAIEASLRDE
uniref:Uncharacterized protein n=1 Tax=Ciona savignyi TaxID=51511 RepID=H2ZG71_CIOSA